MKASNENMIGFRAFEMRDCRVSLLSGFGGMILVSVRKSARRVLVCRWWFTELRLQESPGMYEKEIENGLEVAGLVAAVDWFIVLEVENIF